MGRAERRAARYKALTGRVSGSGIDAPNPQGHQAKGWYMPAAQTAVDKKKAKKAAHDKARAERKAKIAGINEQRARRKAARDEKRRKQNQKRINQAKKPTGKGNQADNQRGQNVRVVVGLLPDSDTPTIDVGALRVRPGI